MRGDPDPTLNSGRGIVGAGMVARFHARAIAETPGARLAALCRADAARAEEAAAEPPGGGPGGARHLAGGQLGDPSGAELGEVRVVMEPFGQLRVLAGFAYVSSRSVRRTVPLAKRFEPLPTGVTRQGQGPQSPTQELQPPRSRV